MDHGTLRSSIPGLLSKWATYVLFPWLDIITISFHALKFTKCFSQIMHALKFSKSLNYQQNPMLYKSGMLYNFQILSFTYTIA